MKKPLFKTTIVIWSEYDPSGVELDDLAREAIGGDAYCSKTESVKVEKPDQDSDWDGTEFFADPSDEIEKDDDGNCIYCGQKCFEGQMCDEQQAGGFNKE